jgi:HSP20 family protein
MMLRQMFDLPNYGWKNAFDELEKMRQDRNRLFGSVSGRPYWQAHAGVFPLVNISEDVNNFYICSEIPGMESKEIHISATGRGLTITGERKIVSEGENVKYHRREREGGTFNRIISLPEDIQVEKIDAGYEDGILTITIPRADAAKPKTIEVK